MITFNESRLHFTFDDTAVWQVVMKVDGHTDYKKTQVMQSFKIVDFACVRNNEVMFVEAKNYTGHSLPANIDRLINDIASKVKDTICCAVAANLNSTSDQINWNRITTELSNPNVAIKVVFWMEDGYPNTSRARAGANIYGNKLKLKLTWLTNGHNVLVANTHIGGIQGLVVA